MSWSSSLIFCLGEPRLLQRMRPGLCSQGWWDTLAALKQSPTWLLVSKPETTREISRSATESGATERNMGRTQVTRAWLYVLSCEIVVNVIEQEM